METSRPEHIIAGIHQKLQFASLPELLVIASLLIYNKNSTAIAWVMPLKLMERSGEGRKAFLGMLLLVLLLLDSVETHYVLKMCNML